VKSEHNFAIPLTKLMGRNMILETSRGMRLKHFANKKVMVPNLCDWRSLE